MFKAKTILPAAALLVTALGLAACGNLHGSRAGIEGTDYVVCRENQAMFSAPVGTVRDGSTCPRGYHVETPGRSAGLATR